MENNDYSALWKNNEKILDFPFDFNSTSWNVISFSPMQYNQYVKV
jgi:hypothetical protein